VSGGAAAARRAICGAALALVLFGLGACQRAGGGSVELAMAPESALPEFVRGAPPQVREAYRFAIANRELLVAIPCYCGCGAMGHRSNLDCYIKSVRADGSIEFEDHAFG
jgi:hypothetical protein